MLLCVRIDKDSQWQRWGVDRQILLPHGRQIFIDEKKRDTKWDDFLVEEWGDLEQGRVGWTLDMSKRSDFIAYSIPLIGKCYLLPFELLRLTCAEYLPAWKTYKQANGTKCYPKDAKNEGWTTRCCVVSWQNLFKGMQYQMHRQFGTETLNLPMPTKSLNGKQLQFEWE